MARTALTLRQPGALLPGWPGLPPDPVEVIDSDSEEPGETEQEQEPVSRLRLKREGGDWEGAKKRRRLMPCGSDVSTGISSPREGSGSSVCSSSQRFPDIGWAQAMFQALEQKFADITGGLHSRPLQLGTDCSGAEAPWFALQAIKRELASQIQLQLQHRFACDIGQASRRFIAQNSQPTLLFRNLLDRGETGFCLNAQRELPVPSDLDIYVAGFPCKDFSLLNSNRPCLQGPHAATFHGVVNYIKRHEPRTFLLENVQGLTMKKRGQQQAPIEEVMDILRALPYEVRGWRVNSMDYHLPQNRTRVYIVGVRRDLPLQLPLECWRGLVRGMAASPGVPAHAFMLDDTEEEVQAELQRLETWNAEHGRICFRGPKGGRWRATNEKIRKELGVRPDQGPLIPKGCGWSRFLSQRTQDVLELQAIRISKSKAVPDPMNSDFFAEISRSALYGSSRSRSTPCLTPGSKMWAFNRRRWMIGPEMLALQGFPVDELNLEGFTDQQLRVLAGNAMSVPVVGLFLYLILALVRFPEEKTAATLD
ncbi:unnamed protein product [Effrenium voratum]|nr:unnamed protein product [Effrenium voratum]